jgi:hypothetical protein
LLTTLKLQAKDSSISELHQINLKLKAKLEAREQKWQHLEDGDKKNSQEVQRIKEGIHKRLVELD